MDTARINPRRLLAFLGAASLGLLLVLGGLGWDIAMHAADPRLAEHEGVFTLANPSHALFAAGLVVLATGIAGAVLTVAAARPDGSLLRRRGVRAAIATGAALMILGAGGLGAWAQSAAETHGHTHDETTDNAIAHHESSLPMPSGAPHELHGMDEEGAGAHARRLTARDVASATPQQRAAARKLLTDTIAGTAAFRDVEAAKAAGYKFVTDGRPRVYHIPSVPYAKDGRTLDPRRPESLLYIRSPKDGSLVLVGVVFRMEKAGTPGPKIGGPITNWHTHLKCVDPTRARPLDARGGRCPEGTTPTAGVERMHVWFTDSLVTAFSQQAPLKDISSFQRRLSPT